MKLALFVVCASLPSVGIAQAVSFPSNAAITAETVLPVGSIDVPIGPWADGVIPAETQDGRITHQAWRIASPGLTSLQVLRPIREQLSNSGYQTLFECDTEGCGGFDFRFSLPLLPPPEMQVNLGDFRFLSAQSNETPEDKILILVSPAPNAAYVQLTVVSRDDEPISSQSAEPLRGEIGEEPVQAEISVQLETSGSAILNGLVFETGSAQLSGGPSRALQALADYLQANPSRTVALVGHTDSTGSLDGNIALSKRRAGSVLERLVSDYSVDRRQLDAQGMGYLSPVASNLTQEGRDANRRVEVIITSTED